MVPSFVPVGSPINVLYEFLTNIMLTACPAYLILLCLITLVIFGEEML